VPVEEVTGQQSSVFEGPVLMLPGPEIKVSSILGQKGTATKQ
jgi:hypothetical protein